MGVVNLTPDSFSDGGLHNDPRRALDHARRLVAEGAAALDLGGESTRPGATPVSVDEELRRVVPVMELVASELGGSVRLSVDTRNPEVARAAVAVGATLINDVSAALWPVAAELGVGWVAVHGGSDPATMHLDPRYDDVVGEVTGFLDAVARTAADAGVPEVWVDPGIGFSKTASHNLDLLAHLDRLVATGWPVLVGTSRKSTLGQLLATDGEPAPVTDRVEGSIATAVWALERGAAMVRVHDVAATVQAAIVVGP